jgi:peptidoglycan/xylan/chitin deacetylase (PgdA/CDA1 family)
VTPPAGVPILMYHQISEARRTGRGRDEGGNASRPGRLAVPADRFAAQLDRLAEGGFATVTAGELASASAAGRPLRRSVVLTFDDGFADFHHRALPLLLSHGFTATLFVTTGWVGQPAGLPGPGGDHGRSLHVRPRPGQMLTRTQLAEVASAGIEIGAHSHGHPALDGIPGPVMARELADSKAILEDWLGQAVPGMAYPFGYSNERVRRATAAIGHRYACGVGNRLAGQAPDLHDLPRLTIRRSTRTSDFEEIINGLHISRHYRADRSLTRAWAAVRRGRAAVRGMGRDV